MDDDDDSKNTPKKNPKLSDSTSNNQKNTAKKNRKMSNRPNIYFLVFHILRLTISMIEY